MVYFLFDFKRNASIGWGKLYSGSILLFLVDYKLFSGMVMKYCQILLDNVVLLFYYVVA